MSEKMYALAELNSSRSLRDVPAIRMCLTCRTKFDSDGFGERICRSCKTKKAWKDGSLVSPKRSGWRS